jgi:hypothetical protein
MVFHIIRSQIVRNDIDKVLSALNFSLLVVDPEFYVAEMATTTLIYRLASFTASAVRVSNVALAGYNTVQEAKNMTSNPSTLNKIGFSIALITDVFSITSLTSRFTAESVLTKLNRKENIHSGLMQHLNEDYETTPQYTEALEDTRRVKKEQRTQMRSQYDTNDVQQTLDLIRLNSEIQELDIKLEREYNRPFLEKTIL